MIRRPPRSTLFPYTTLFRSPMTMIFAEVANALVRIEQDIFLPVVSDSLDLGRAPLEAEDRKSTRLNSSHDQISYAVFCLKKKKKHRRGPTQQAMLPIVDVRS